MVTRVGAWGTDAEHSRKGPLDACSREEKDRRERERTRKISWIGRAWLRVSPEECSYVNERVCDLECRTQPNRPLTPAFPTATEPRHQEANHGNHCGINGPSKADQSTLATSIESCGHGISFIRKCKAQSEPPWNSYGKQGALDAGPRTRIFHGLQISPY